MHTLPNLQRLNCLLPRLLIVRQATDLNKQRLCESRGARDKNFAVATPSTANTVVAVRVSALKGAIVSQPRA